MKKLMITFLLAIVAIAFPLQSVFAAEVHEAGEVDGDSARWEQESVNATSLGTLYWDKLEKKIHMSGKGYKDRVGMKFGFRYKVAFDKQDTSITVKFPDVFEMLYSPETIGEDGHKIPGNNMHYVFALTNTYSEWWNSNGKSMKSIGFVVRPMDQDTVMVQLAGRFNAGDNGYGDIIGKEVDGNIAIVEPVSYTLSKTREMKVGVKKSGDMYAVYVNDEKLGDLNYPILCDGSTQKTTMSQVLETKFKDGKAYWQFGNTVEHDSTDTNVSLSFIKMFGAIDAFLPPPPPPEKDDSANTYVPNSGSSSQPISVAYFILYPLAGLIGIGSLVCFLLDKYKKKI